MSEGREAKSTSISSLEETVKDLYRDADTALVFVNDFSGRKDLTSVIGISMVFDRKGRWVWHIDLAGTSLGKGMVPQFQKALSLEGWSKVSVEILERI